MQKKSAGFRNGSFAGHVTSERFQDRDWASGLRIPLSSVVAAGLTRSAQARGRGRRYALHFRYPLTRVTPKRSCTIARRRRSGRRRKAIVAGALFIEHRSPQPELPYWPCAAVLAL